MLIRPNRCFERPMFLKQPRLGWVLITPRWVIARGFYAHAYA